MAFVNQISYGGHAVFLFKDKYNKLATIEPTWTGQSDYAPTTSTVYLQIYNRNSTTWETVDSNNTSGADANFTLTGTITTNLSDYFDANWWVSCRVYQEAAPD
jgi:hypothetical protein